MAKLLTVAEASKLLGVSSDTVRRWVEDGALPAIRTMGGHLRLRESDVAAFRRQAQDGGAARDGSTRSAAQAREPEPPEWQRLPPWEQKKAELKANLEIQDLMAERRRQRRERARERLEERRRAAEEKRLNELKLYGLSMLPIWYSNHKPRLIKVLERFVTSENIPPYLDEWEQRQMVCNRVLQFNRALWDTSRRSRK